MNNEGTRVAVMTTVFPGVEPYLNEFFLSQEKQTFKEFVLVIVNDGLDTINDWLKQHIDLDVCVIDVQGTPAENRMAGIQYCLDEGFEFIVFSDSDDSFEINRIELLVSILNKKSADIVVNDIHLIKDDGEIIDAAYLSNRLIDEQFIYASDLIHYNMLGLSNTAVRTKNLTGIALDSTLVAVDWYLFATLLCGGCKSIFTNKTHSLYRQHDLNTVGIGSISLAGIKKSILVKSNHYGLLAINYHEFSNMAKYFDVLAARLGDEDYIKRYANECISKLPKKPFWWEEAMYIEGM